MKNKIDIRKIDQLTLVKNALTANPILLDKISESCNVPKEQVDELLLEVMRFLSLIAHTTEKLTPSIIVDFAWHELILCTRHYHQLCENTFGRYIHHHPGGMEKENKAQYARTLSLYQTYFGNLPEQYWLGINHQTMADASDCGSCSS